MNIASRGVRNAFRSVVRSGSIVIILALSVGLIIAMLAARQAVIERIETVKSSVGNTISISPAGMRGFEGGGEALTGDDIAKVAAVSHVSGVSSQLSDRLTTDDTTSLTSAVELGSLGMRRAQQGSGNSDEISAPEMPVGGFNPASSITATGINDTSSASVWGGSSVSWTSGEAFDGASSENVAAIGTSIAEKNGLKIGDTFTAYGTELTVTGIYDSGNTFANNGVFVPLATLQRISGQPGSITSATAAVDSVDNLSPAAEAISAALGESADVTSSQEMVDNAVKPLESVKTVALFSLIGALAAGAVVILMTMVMVVRERRREIGVMKAIGSSSGGIAAQFTVEAVTLTAAALVIGLAIGVAASTPLTNALVSSSAAESGQQAGPGNRGGGGPGAGMRQFGRSSVQTAQDITSSVGAQTIAYGVGATLLIAILGSAVPALLISKVKPAEAMRSE